MLRRVAALRTALASAALERSTFSRNFSVSHSASARVGFVGLGQMGARMAVNLGTKGHDLVLYDVSEDAVRDVAGKVPQSVAATSPAQVAEMASVVVTMLPTSTHVAEVYDAMYQVCKPGALFIEASTIEAAAAKTNAGLAEKVGANVLDAPVSGGVGGAEAGTLTFMVGGTETAFEQGKPFLQCMGKNLVHCGESGSGQVAKVCNNLLLAITMIGTSEAMALGTKLGMDPKVLAGIINSSTGRCWASDTYNPYPGVIETAPSSRGYTGGFAVELMAKDLRLAREACTTANFMTPLGDISTSIYNELASLEEFRRKDFSVVYDILQNSPRVPPQGDKA